MNENYNATIVSLTNLRKHPNADRLQCTNIFGNNVIVGNTEIIGDLGIYFPLECAISKEFLSANNLYQDITLNSNQNIKGYFSKNGRVRCQKFRGEHSMGFWLPIDSLRLLGDIEGFVDSMQISDFHGIPICRKYVPPHQGVPGPRQAKTRTELDSKIVSGQFHQHFDTAQLGRNMDKIQLDDVVSLTWKFHGTSFIGGNLLCRKKLSLFQRTLSKVPFVSKYIKHSTHFDYVWSSRKVIKNGNREVDGGFYKYDLWTDVGERLFRNKLHKGETVYGEVVGYLPTGAGIQGKGTGIFDYNCDISTNRFVCYRITMTNEDGLVTELQWPQVLQRSKEIGVETVPTIFYGTIRHLCHIYGIHVIDETRNENQEWRNMLLEELKGRFLEIDSQFCKNKVPEEGIVLRKEGLIIESFKLKAFRFLEKETKDLDENIVDIETEQAEFSEAVTP